MAARRRLVALLRHLRDGGRLMVGVPSYAAYLTHLHTRHPGAEPMSEAQFLEDRQRARFGGGGRGGFRCC